jgi:hypothetical protein
MDKKHENELKRLAGQTLEKYRIARRSGYSPKVARAHAHFSIMCLSGGRKNLFAENLLRRYKRV